MSGFGTLWQREPAEAANVMAIHVQRALTESVYVMAEALRDQGLQVQAVCPPRAGGHYPLGSLRIDGLGWLGIGGPSDDVVRIRAERDSAARLPRGCHLRLTKDPPGARYHDSCLQCHPGGRITLEPDSRLEWPARRPQGYAGDPRAFDPGGVEAIWWGLLLDQLGVHRLLEAAG